MNAEKLIEKTANGNKKAFEELYLGYKGLVFSVALGVLKSRELAEDVLADTFIKAFTQASQFKGGSGKAWLCSIARNLSLNILARRKREIPTDFEENESTFGCYQFEDEFAEKTVLSAALSKLSDSERQVVLLHNAGLKHREIAEMNDESIGTITSRYKFALSKLRKYLE